MSGTLKYKATERYSVGWTDPRGAFAVTDAAYAGIKFGDYYIVDLGIDVMHFYHNGFRYGAKKEDLASFVEAFWKEKKDGESNTVQRGDEAGLRPQHHFGKSEG